MLINFLVRDDTDDGARVQSGWQSGFYSVRGAEKPSLRAFMLPLAQVSRTGTRTIVWGQIRPRSGPQPYRLQELRDGDWQWLGGIAQTGSTGTFVRTVSAAAGSRLRVWSPGDRVYSLVLTVR
jgi:hypothetical protein